MKRHQPLFGHYQIGQSEKAVQLRMILGQTPVTGHLVAEQVLDDVQRVLDLGLCADLDQLGLLDHLARRAVAQQPPFAKLHRDVPLRPLPSFSNFRTLGHTAVARVPECISLFAVHQRASLRQHR